MIASLLLIACSAAPPAAGDLEVRIMSFNIRCGTSDEGENHWEKRREIVFDVIRRHKPDALGLQEVLKFQAEELRKALPDYGRLGAGADPGQKKSEHALILYRMDRFQVGESGTFWFSDTPDVPGSKSWGNKIPRICTWARLVDVKSGKSFYIYNAHLDHISQPSRERSAEYLWKRIRRRACRDPVTIMGDFNAGEDNRAVLYLLGGLPLTSGEKGDPPAPSFLDTFRVLHPKAVDAGTFHRFKGKRDGEKIDFILAQPAAKVLEAEILHDRSGGRYPSDHFPVTAKLRFPEAGEY